MCHIKCGTCPYISDLHFKLIFTFETYIRNDLLLTKQVMATNDVMSGIAQRKKVLSICINIAYVLKKIHLPMLLRDLNFKEYNSIL